MKRALAFAPLIVLVLLVAVSAFLLTRGGERATVTDGLVGRPAPAYSLERLGGGEPVTSAALEGRAYLINLFASYCTPCLAEHPLLMELKSQGVRIVGVAHRDEPADAVQFLARLGDPFSEVGLDPDGRFALELGAAGMPETFVVAADGTIRAVHRGALTPEIVAEKIVPALGGVGN